PARRVRPPQAHRARVPLSFARLRTPPVPRRPPALSPLSGDHRHSHQAGGRGEDGPAGTLGQPAFLFRGGCGVVRASAGPGPAPAEKGGSLVRSRPFFRYSPSDAIPALCGVAIVAFLLWTFLAFDRLPWWALVAAFVVAAWS